MAIVLRKYRGKLEAMQRALGARFAGTGPTSSVDSALRSPTLLLLLLVAVLACWALAHGGGGFHAPTLLGVAGLTGAQSNLLIEKRQQLSAKTKAHGEVMALISGPDDYGNAKVLELLGATDMAGAKEKLGAQAAELEALGRDIDTLTIEEYKAVNRQREEELKRPLERRIPGSNLTGSVKSFGELVVADPEWKGSKTPMYTTITADLGEDGVKTLLQTSAGWQPRTANGTILVDKIIRPVQILDIIPMDRTDLFEIPSMEETTRTQAAAELAEAGTYAEDAFAFTRRTSPIRKIGSEIPVTDEQLDDVPGMAGLLNNRLTFGVRARIDLQAVAGDGTGSNLTGLLNASNIQTQAKGADATANAIMKAITLVRVSGRTAPTHVLMHGTDIQNLRLAQNAQGDYQFGPPYVAGEQSAWGIPIVQTEALSQGTALVVSFNPLWVCLYYRKDIEVQVGFINDQFIKGQKTLRGDARVGLWIGRGQSICKVTGL